jgi:hypothetical protein
MFIALCVVAAAFVLLVLHLVALPLAKKRPVLLRGVEPAVALALLILCLCLLVPFLWTLFVLQALAGYYWRPWFVVGITRDQTTDAIARAASMVRLKNERTDAAFSLAGIGSASVVSVGRVHMVMFRVVRTKKLVLFQNVLRKTVQNYTLATR